MFGVYQCCFEYICVFMRICLGVISDSILIILFTFLPPSPLLLSSIIFSIFFFFPLLQFHHLLPPHFFFSPLIFPSQSFVSITLSAFPGGRPCWRRRLRGAGHSEQPVPVECGVPWCHLPTCHTTVWGHQGRRWPWSGQRGLGHGGRPQGEAPAEDGMWMGMRYCVQLDEEISGFSGSQDVEDYCSLSLPDWTGCFNI